MENTKQHFHFVQFHHYFNALWVERIHLHLLSTGNYVDKENYLFSKGGSSVENKTIERLENKNENTQYMNSRHFNHTISTKALARYRPIDRSG